jgi:hypothetical protein
MVLHRVGIGRSPAGLVAFAVAAVAACGGVLWAVSATDLSAVGTGVHARPTAGLSALPVAARGPVSAELGSANPAYRLSGSSAANPAQRLRLGFSRAGVSIASGSGRTELSLTAVGRGGALRSVPGVAPRAWGNRVAYAWPRVRGWYANGPLGLEQGFTLARAPAAGSGPVVLSLSLTGNLHARLDHGSVRLSGAGASLRYDGLSALDARGRALHAWLSVHAGGLLVHVDDRGAAYPLRIDPLIQQGSKLVGTGASGAAQQGFSVALSADGSTALIGGPSDNSRAGAAWVFVRSGANWTQQGSKLVGTGAVGGAQQGNGVALSADGDTALIGGPGDNSFAGAAWVFTRSGSTWSQQGAKLVGTGAVGAAREGFSVALSTDGNTALIGGTGDNSFAGATWVFTRSGSTWAQQGAKLVGTGANQASQGYSVALSSDGDTALIGGPFDASSVAGAAWVFVRSGTTWTQQGAKLGGTGAVGNAFEGSSVALSADGDTALIGGPVDASSGGGAAWVFVRSGTTWSQQGQKLVGTGGTGGNAQEGSGVALSADGNTALIGGPWDNLYEGGAWVFTRLGSTWTQQGAKLVGTGGNEASQGSSVALSADGDTALIGGPFDIAGGALGAAWVFVNQATLTVTRAGSGSGTVSSSPPGISCGSTCSAQFNTGTQVTLHATPAAGSAFAGWSGGGCSGIGSCTITLSSDQSVTATYSSAPPPPPSTATLSVTRAGSGSGTVSSSPPGISCGSTCSAQFDAGTQVMLTAAPAAGSAFAGWSGGGCSGIGSCTITLSSDQSVTAMFSSAPPPPPSTATLSVTRAGSGSGTVSSSPPGIACGSTCSAQFDAGTQVMLTAAPAAGSAFAGWSGGGCAGIGTCTITLSSETTITATFTTIVASGLPPASTTAPTITGTPAAGGVLSCSPGGWSGNPTTLSYQWSRDGTPIQGATSSTYAVQTLDEGSTLTCSVTASNATASATATSRGVSIAIPFVPHCPAATGRIAGSTLGLIHLGMTRQQAHHAYRHSSSRGSKYKDFFCLTPIGVRVGYASPKLLYTLTPTQRKDLDGRVVWASTSSPYYALDAIRRGSTIALATQRLHTSRPYHVGLNDWYVGTYRSTRIMIKARHGIIQELGIANKQLTSTGKATHTFLSSFY